MILKIKVRAQEKNKYAIGLSECIEVVDIETGKDVTAGLKSLRIFVGVNEVATAQLEYYVNELDLEGIGVVELIEND